MTVPRAVEIPADSMVSGLVLACERERGRWAANPVMGAAVPSLLRDGFMTQFWDAFPDVDQHWRSSAWSQYWHSKMIDIFFVQDMELTLSNACVVILVWPRGNWIRGEVAL